MTDAEKDREAVESFVRATAYQEWEAWEPGVRVLALAREALEMRERGPVGYRVRIQQRIGGVAWSGWSEWRTYEEIPDFSGYDTPIRTSVVPLYAGTPEEVPND